MVEIPGSVTIIPAPIETVLMSVAEELLVFFLIGGAILLAVRIHCWRIQKKIDAADALIQKQIDDADARLKRGMIIDE